MSGSQIKLFIQINDLETSESVAEMLGETTQVYKTPIQRPGQGIFAPRVWAPPRPLRSLLELREMSARLSILMVKNSRSFELIKIRHYADNPYRTFYEKAKATPPVLPTLREWQDESLGGAINPAPEQPQEPTEAAAPLPTTPARARKATAPRRNAQDTATKAKPSELPQEFAPLTLSSRHPTPQIPPRKTLLSLGATPLAPPGENCDVRDILASAANNQEADFVAMASVLRVVQAASPEIREATEVLATLHQSFGDNQKSE